MFTFRQLICVSLMVTAIQLVSQQLKPVPDFTLPLGMIIGYFTLIFNLWVFKLLGLFSPPISKESTND